MKKSGIRRLVLTALFTALCLVATMVIRIPSPTGGYIHPGDCVVLLSAFFLGPVWGAVASGIGSALADVLSGYIIYAPATFIIKACMALCAAAILKNTGDRRPALWVALAGIAAEIIMLGGYFFFTSVILGLGWGAFAEIPGNLVQGSFGVLASSALYLALRRLPNADKLF